MPAVPSIQPGPKKHRVPTWAVLLVIVVLTIAGIGVVLYIGSLPVVDVTAINLTSTDNACGVGGHTFAGFTASAGALEQDTLTIPNLAFSSCTINSVQATTVGFGIYNANVPVTIPYRGTQSLSFTIQVPSSTFNGVLTVDIE